MCYLSCNHVGYFKNFGQIINPMESEKIGQTPNLIIHPLNLKEFCVHKTDNVKTLASSIYM